MFDNNEFEIIISSDLQYEELCSEIYFNAQFLALITRESGLENAIVQIYSPSNKQSWIFNYFDFIKNLKNAKDCLLRIDENKEILKKELYELHYEFNIVNSDIDTISILYKDLPFAKLTREKKNILLEIHPHPKDDSWEFSLDQALLAFKIVDEKGAFE